MDNGLFVLPPGVDPCAWDKTALLQRAWLERKFVMARVKLATLTPRRRWTQPNWARTLADRLASLPARRIS